MTKKSEIISEIARITGDSKKATEEFLNIFLDIISKGLINGEEIEVGGLGTFKTRKREASKGRNPQTGEEIDIPELNAITFKAEKEFIKNINEN